MKDNSNIAIIKNIFVNKVYRFVLFGTLTLTLILPFLIEKMILPAFYNQMIQNTLDEAQRVGVHIARHQNADAEATFIKVAINKLQEDFKIKKIKLFDTNGYITYSTDKKDIGTKNTHEYFYQKVAKGEIYYKVVTKGKETLDNDVIYTDVAEIYLPIVKNGIFCGASEIYYDITEKTKSLNDLMVKINRIEFMISTIFFIFVLVLLFNISSNNLKKKEIENELKELNNSLNEKVQQQTKKLLEINDTLEIKIAQEIEKNRQKDIKIFQQAKLASMGEMIANIAHQWRQPLSAISGIASGISVQNSLGIFDNTKLNELMEKVVTSTQYLSQTIEDFRNFFKEDKERQKVQISKVIDRTLSIIGDSLKHENIIAIVELQEDKVINTFVNELEQALLNIIKNSKDALIDERNIALDEKYIFITLQIEDENLRIEIKDNAGGIPPSIIDKIFDPYFTTKHQSQGTGIGLYMTEEIVVKHLNGKLDVNNFTYEYKGKEYTGASFSLTIPLFT